MNFLSKASSRTLFDSLDISEDTKQDYLSRLPNFLGFVGRNGITQDLLLDYKKHLREQVGIGVATKNKRLAVARITLRELYRQGIISVDLSQGVKSFRQDSLHKVSGLTDEDVARITTHLENSDETFFSLRLRAIIALLLFQGLRTVEICRLDVDDYKQPTSTLLVTSKGRDDKEPIHLHPKTTKALTAYLKQSYVKDGSMFYPLIQKKQPRRITTRGVRLIITSLFEELGIERTVHGCRHWYTTRLIKTYKSDLTTVAKFTRHRSLEMLSIYNDSIITERDLPKFYAALETGPDT